MNTINKKEIHQLSIKDMVPVEMGNPGDTDYEGVQTLEVQRIHKTESGWQFMGKKTKANGDQLLCVCTTGPYEYAYYTTMAMAYGDVCGRPRSEAIEHLGFSRD